MKKSRFSDTQILSILKQAESDIPIPEICSEQVDELVVYYHD